MIKIMKNSSFVHLHLHTTAGSILDGYGTIPAYINRIKEMGFHYAGVTDHGTINGAIQWQKECEKQGIHPIIGCELYIVPDYRIKQKGEKRNHASVWVKNREGWANLCKMLTIANLEGFYHRPRVDYDLLLNHASGLIIGTACASSFLLSQNSESFLQEICKKTEVYFEIMPHKIPAQKIIHDRIKKLSKKFPDIPFCATNDCHWILPEDAEAQEMLLAIQQRKTWDDPERWKFGFTGLHVRSADEMISTFEKQNHWPQEIVDQAMQNTISIARKCFRFKIPKHEVNLPRPPIEKDIDETALLNSICGQGYISKFGTDKWKDNYRDQYLKEIQLISDKGFVRYFLIIYDLLQWAKENNIMYGPGRGSVAGSLIAFLMNITTVDPVSFGLSFSRFLNEDRSGLPDIDVDFEKRYRGKVVQYLKTTYGVNNTCGVSTIGKMQSKGAIRDVCRVMEVPFSDVNNFANAIWTGSTIQECVDNRDEGKYFAKKYLSVLKLILKMEGQSKFKGVHPAAVIISADDLTKSDRCVIVERKGERTCNWDMQDSEYAGLLKLDILGLSTLSVLAEAKKMLNRENNPRGYYHDIRTKQYLFLNHMTRELEEEYKNCKLVDFDFDKIPLEDEETFKMISDGNTAGIFHLSGFSCTTLCKRMKIHSFEDIVAALALARPGPADSGMQDEFVARKHGAEWKPKHPIYEDVTKDTYGILIYQEQIMQVISRVAGLSESVADKIRKVIGKKRDAKEFEPYWKMFSEGCEKMKTLSQTEAKDFWNGLLMWANYGFSRNHAVPYAMIAYHTAWLKTHAPKEFYAAALTFTEWNEKSRDKNKHKNSLLSEVKQAGYSIVSPKRKYSNELEWCFHDKKFYVPFVEINGVGESNAAKCLEPIAQSRIQGFFGEEYNVNAARHDTKLNQLLKELEVDNPDTIPSNKILSKYLPHLDLQKNGIDKYPNLAKIVGASISEKDLQAFQTLKNIGNVKNIIQRKRFRLEQEVLHCHKCELRKQVNRPVLSSTGLHNVTILLEAPGKQEHEQERMAVGPAGQLLWEELAKYNYSRRFFHITNACRCWPSTTRTPTHAEINKCYRWLDYELKKIECRLILACGNIPLYALTGKESGITELSGTTKWEENVGVWVCYCIHPSAVLRNESNRGCFENGIKNFMRCVELLRIN